MRLRYLLVFLVTSFVSALTPSNLRNTDPLHSVFYYTELFQGQEAIVPRPPGEIKDRLLRLIQQNPSLPHLYRELAEVEVTLHQFAEAEKHMKEYFSKATDKDTAYQDLKNFYHQRLMYDDALQVLLKQAAATPTQKGDPAFKRGKYARYQEAIEYASRYRLSVNEVALYQQLVDAYPDDPEPLIQWIRKLKDSDRQKALDLLESLRKKYQDRIFLYLETKADLLSSSEGAEFLSQHFDPLWELSLHQKLDDLLVAAGRKGAYLNDLQIRLKKNPLDFDATIRLFFAFYLSENLMDAQNLLYDYRLLKEQSVANQKTRWSTRELYILARLNQKLGNLNEQARFAYSLYFHLRNHPEDPFQDLTPEDALYLLFDALVQAENRPVQIGSGSLDYYKDIATADSSPGFLNGILSLLFNDADLPGEFDLQQTKAIGYFNRAHALRLLAITERDYPDSPHLATMHRQLLAIYQKYERDELIVQEGEQFFKRFKDSPEIFEVAMAVADAYARMNQPEKEWQTYEFILPIVARWHQGPLFKENSEEKSGARNIYRHLFKRYVGSLNQKKNYNAILNLYRAQIQTHPHDESIYEDFATYLAENNLYAEEEALYQKAIQQFKKMSWYEKLARWYIRRNWKQKYRLISQQIINTFEGTEIEKYLQETLPAGTPYRNLAIALNRYANERFPYNLQFVHNLRKLYSETDHPQWTQWAAISARYYYLDESIRNSYLAHLARNKRLPYRVSTGNPVETRFAADVKIWRSHFEEAIPDYEKLAAARPAEKDLILRLSDLKRSLGRTQESFQLRHSLAKITPSDSSLWTTAGEVVADAERYEEAGRMWEKILEIDPQNPERYLEVATIYWDYYQLDRALEILARARAIQNDPALYAFETGAIYEAKRDYSNAIREYVIGHLAKSSSATSRLTDLYLQPRWQDMIRQQLWARLHQHPQDPEVWYGVLQFYIDQREKESAQEALRLALATMNPKTFAQSAGKLKEIARTQSFHEIQEQIIQRQIAEAGSELDSIVSRIELAHFYESLNRKAQADASYEKLYKDYPKSLGVLQDVIAYYWRSKQYDQAFHLYQQAIVVSNANFRTSFQLELAQKYREREKWKEALAVAKELLNQTPLNPTYFQLVAEIYAQQKNYQELARHYAEGLKRFQEANLPEEEKKNQIASIRRGIIQAHLILKDYAAALDQYIEILNRDAESEETLLQVAEFARRHDLQQRLIDYYNKTTIASPKDHRWPMILARLYLLFAQPEAAIARFQSAITLRPERIDLRSELADACWRLGRYSEAMETYEKIYQLTYRDPQWLEQLAELHARQGNKTKAFELYEQALKSRSEYDRLSLITTKAMAWGEPERTIEYGQKAIDQFFADPTLGFPETTVDPVLTAMIQTAPIADTFHWLDELYHRIRSVEESDTYSAEAFHSAAYILRKTFTQTFPRLVTQYATAEQLQQLDNTVRHIVSQISPSEWLKQVQKIYLPFARAAGMAPLEEHLLLQMVAKLNPEDESYSSFYDEVKQFYFERHAFARAAQWMEQELPRLQSNIRFRHELAFLAKAYRLAGKSEKELDALRRYYLLTAKEDPEPEAVERYIDLLYSNELHEELRTVARNANFISANYFLQKKDKELVLIAIESLGKDRDPVWKTVQKGMLARDWKLDEEQFHQAFRTALDLRTIGEQLQSHSVEGNHLLGDDWFYYGTRYGEYLFWLGHEKADFYLPSDLEGAPTSPERQMALAHFYLEEHQYEPAARHFQLALQLKPNEVHALNSLGVAHAETGKKDDALAVWNRMLEKAPVPTSYQLYLQHAIKYGFLDTALPLIQKFLLEKIQKTGESGITDLIALYLSLLPEPQQIETIEEWLQAAPSRVEFGNTLLNLADNPATPWDPPVEVRLSIYRSVEQYLNSWMLTALGQEQETVRNKWIEWIKNYALALFENDQFAAALQKLEEVKETMPSLSPELNKEFVLLTAEILIAQGNIQSAVTVLKDFLATPDSGTTENYHEASELLSYYKKEQEAHLLLKDLYEKEILSSPKNTTHYLNLAEIYLQLNEQEMARTILKTALFIQQEDPQMFEKAAELLEKFELYADAVLLRQDLERRIPWNTSNRAHLAHNLLKLGKTAEAASKGTELLRDRTATLQDRLLAVKSGGKPAGGELAVITQVLSAKAEPPAEDYSIQARQIYIESVESPSFHLLLGQFYFLPNAKDIQIKLFDTYYRNGQCLLALQTLDPDNMRSGEYYPPEEYEESEDYYGDLSSENPVERLELRDEQTRVIALQMAACAAEQKDPVGELFFLKMAQYYMDPETPDEKTDQRIAELEGALEKKTVPWVLRPGLGREA